MKYSIIYIYHVIHINITKINIFSSSNIYIVSLPESLNNPENPDLLFE